MESQAIFANDMTPSLSPMKLVIRKEIGVLAWDLGLEANAEENFDVFLHILLYSTDPFD